MTGMFSTTGVRFTSVVEMANSVSVSVMAAAGDLKPAYSQQGRTQE